MRKKSKIKKQHGKQISNIKLRRGDEIMVTSGKDKGKTGKIEKVFTKDNKVLVSGVNQYKRHVRGRTKDKSEIVSIIKPLPVSNVMLICPNCKKATRVGYKIEGKEKVRICVKCKKKI